MSVLKKITHRFFIVGFLICTTFSYAQKTATREYQVKAAFIFNFTQFVEWPAAAFASDQAPLVIGILGENPFGSYLEETVFGEKVNGHPLVVQYYKSVEEIKVCHILFVSLTDPQKQRQVISGLKGRSILTVSDAAGFLQEGGIIRLFTKDGKIQLQINLEASKEPNVAISSKLLKLAEIFVPDKRN